MRPKGYLIFHLNLGFSSIEEKAWPDVIQNCYHPLLDLIENSKIPIGVELTGWTLKQIGITDYAWIERFKALLKTNHCELIGSGYSQIIGPLVPYTVNMWNQKLGLSEYERILGLRPNIVLVNEMAYSSSLVDLYTQFGYKGFIMDRDNVRLTLGIDELPMSAVPTHAKGIDENILPILWADSILFQKMQHYAHGDAAIVDYLDYLKKRIKGGETLLPIYCNDAEVFDYRPGRFSEERPSHFEGEWVRVKKLLDAAVTETGIEWISPSQALKINDQCSNHKVSRLTSATYPIPVKKQAKYNIARWAVTGRDDLWLNTMCHRIAKHFSKNKNTTPDDWRQLCELWASDFRTHITQKRWHKAKKQLSVILEHFNISNSFGQSYIQAGPYDSLKSAIGQYGGAKVELINDGILLKISTKKIQIEFNMRRGLAINSLAFASHEMEPCIGTLQHGYFTSISLGADYYSGGVVIELPKERKRITDLEPVIPSFSLQKGGDIEVTATIPTIMGDIIKVFRISPEEEGISLKYYFPKWGRPVGSIRLGIITMLTELNDGDSYITCSNGGENIESFKLCGDVNHSTPSSTLVSSSGGIGATNGSIRAGSKKRNFKLSWNPEDCAVMPMLQCKSSSPESLSRIFFSMGEDDDTLKEASLLSSFSFKISAG